MNADRPVLSDGRLRQAMYRLTGLRNRHFLLLDCLLLAVVPLLALLLHLDGTARIGRCLPVLIVYTAGSMALSVGVFARCGLYNRYWRDATVEEMALICAAVTTSTAAVWIGFFVSRYYRLPTVMLPGSLPLLCGLLALPGVGGSRFSARAARRMRREPSGPEAGRALIVGAGMAGQRIVRELRSRPQIGLRPVGYLDDDPVKQGLRILNLPVLGGREALGEITRSQHIRRVIIALPHAPGRTIREIRAQCERERVPVKIVPALSDMLTRGGSAVPLRDVEIEDLLRRERIETDIAAVRKLIEGRRVLVTGGGGSIGSELCRQILRCGPEALMILGHGENSVFDIQNELLTLSGDPPAGDPPALRAVIADIRFAARLRRILTDYRPQILFHAAAHKHVPLMEQNPAEAVSNNVLGTRNLLEAAQAVGVEHFVLISSDKAVRPGCVMGASKRAAELLVLRAARRSGRPYGAVRFGNVLGSRGSVVQTFRRQIAAGGPVTVSHPEMKRYFITIPEAVQLVLQAAALGQGGEVFMLDMGEPVRIVDLARDLIALSGLEEGRDIEIVFTAPRPGEKLFEELFMPGERYERTHHDKILIARNACSFVPDCMEEAMRALEQAVAVGDPAQSVHCLRCLIPEFSPLDARWQQPHACSRPCLLRDRTALAAHVRPARARP